MMDSENIIKALGICADKQCFLQYPEKHCPYEKLQGSYENLCDECTSALAKDTIALLKKQEAVKPQDAEMLIIHNGGAEEYVKDIESIVLLAHKDYDIVYCGRFSEGR